MATFKPIRNVGDFIRDQRRSAEISLRQLARAAGVSNPYLSQIERGLRRPSAEILQQIARALRISAEALYVQAGILEERPADSEVPAAVLGDAALSERQKQVLLEIYESFRKENDARTTEGPPPAAPAELGITVLADESEPIATMPPPPAPAARARSARSRTKPAVGPTLR